MRYRNPIAALLAMVLTLPVPAVTVRAAVLITPQEAKLLAAQAPAGGGGAGVLGGERGTPTRGPDLVIQSPRSAVSSPFVLQVGFTPHGGRKIDPASVTVTLLTKPEVDLTGRVQPFLTPAGINFRDAEVPPGQYKVRIDLADDAGRTTSRTLDIQVLR